MMALIVVALVLASGCGPKRFLTVPELELLEQCVIEAEDQVERQNCVERVIPAEGR